MRDYGLLSICVPYKMCCTCVWLFASSLHIHLNSWTIRQDDVWEQDRFLSGNKNIFIAEYGTAFTMKWLQAVWWHKKPHDSVWRWIWLPCSICFCFESSIYAAFNCLGCSWEWIWYSLLLLLVLVCWKIRELNFCVTITLNPFLIKRLMCQVQLLVPFQRLRRVGE